MNQKPAPAQKMHKQKPLPGKKGKQTQITTAAEHKRVVKMDQTVVVAEFARQMGAKATVIRLVLQTAMVIGIFVYVVWGIQILWGN